MKEKLQPLTESETKVLRKALPKAVERFVHDREDHVTDVKTFFEVWFEMPGMREQYASLGFTTHPEPLYWTMSTRISYGGMLRFQLSFGKSRRPGKQLG